jgi:hypothetical protein
MPDIEWAARTADARAPAAPAEALIPPQLAKLNLTDAQLAALRRQGFVNPERRNGRTVYKLRLRVEGVQIVRFLGTNRQRAESLAAELRHWQSGRRRQLEAGQLRKTLRALLRRQKRQLTPLVEQAGFRFHGRHVRRPRKPRQRVD